MSATITNGKIIVGRTIKTGDYENKRFDVELSFTIPEDGDAEVSDYISAVGELALKQMNDMIADKLPAPTAAQVKAAKLADKVEKPEPKKAPKIPAPVKAAETAEEEDPLADRATPPFIAKEVAEANAKASDVAEDSLDGLFGEEEDKKEITDKELTDAVQRCSAACKNNPAIHKAIAATGPKIKRLVEIPQNKRQFFLDELAKIKPLA